MKRTILIVTFVAFGAAAWLTASGHLDLQKWLQRPDPTSAEAGEQPVVSTPPSASVLKVARADFVETVMVTGTLVPRDEILVAPEVEGLRVLEVHADEGDRVEKGQLLATLVHATLDAQLAQNAALLAKSDAAIAQAASSITQAEARLEEARNALERAKPLKQSGHIAESVFDQREAAAKTAGAILVAARDGLKVAEAEKAHLEAQRRELEWRRSKTEVKAPADGLISRRNVRIGSLALSLGDAMFKIIARGEIELDAEVPEAQLARMKAGQPAVVTVAGFDAVAGTVRLVSPEIDKATRLGRVRISLESEEPLRIGGFGRGTVVTANGSGLAVPASALLYGQDGATVQVVDNGRVRSRRVKTGLRADGLVEILEGLTEGDVVIARSGTFLRDGDEVRPAFEPAGKLSEVR
ncbi:MAG: efflux RND transporter periplasmic adaptor subunit [Hyphomicrobiaceae bacterium]|nr:efflux RND transporter periplasmic adaptor subunit [Hyphomicrobiaceae bacterium]